MDSEISNDYLSLSGGDNTMANNIDDLLSLSGGDTAMANEDDSLSIRIGEKLLAPFLMWSGHSILKLPKHLRDVNEKAYEPQVIAIGPYHRGKSHLMFMEEQKKVYLKMLLERRRETDVKRYVKAIKALERRARTCYEDFVDLGTDEFVEMMLFDGCFIVELLRKSIVIRLSDSDDHIIKVDWFFQALCRDLLLVENQLPFFVLQEFYDMTWTQNEQFPFPHMFYVFFYRVLPSGNLHIEKVNELITRDYIQNVNHLVGFLHDVCGPSPSKIEAYRKSKATGESEANGEIESNWEFIRNATELKEAGIKFKKVEGAYSLFEITFNDGVMEIPRLLIGDDTETIFRNLIAYEQFFLDKSLKYVSDYIKFMDSLINSPNDVKLLCQLGIIDNWLGDEEVIANMFNKLGDYIIISPENFFYSELFKNVNKHCRRRRNKWMANLRHNYFNKPWAWISFLAAFLVLLLTFFQTLYSFLEHFK